MMESRTEPNTNNIHAKLVNIYAVPGRYVMLRSDKTVSENYMISNIHAAI